MGQLAAAIHSVATILIVSAAIVSVVYVAGSLGAVIARQRRQERLRAPLAVSVTILKPLCGAEPGLEENLRSFCGEAGPGVEILFGARDGDDPGLVTARRVAAEFPGIDAQFIAGSPVLGLNAKVNTLAHLAGMARHDVLVVADSDTRVTPGYLSCVVAPVLEPSVGVVSCLFRSRPTGTFWSQFGALSIDEWFIPSVLVSRALRSPAYCSGPMIVLRREVLNAIGGFAILTPFLADDYELGARVRRQGYRSLIADCEVTATVNEPTGADLVRHELRWMRTVRTVTPLGYALSVLTYAVPLTVIAAGVSGAMPWTLALVGIAVALRAAIHRIVPAPVEDATMPRPQKAPLWVVVLRDFFSFGMWVASYASRNVTWRGRAMSVGSDGILRPFSDRRSWSRRLCPRLSDEPASSRSAAGLGEEQTA
jgi:ceramide glucosyltransferase